MIDRPAFRLLFLLGLALAVAFAIAAIRPVPFDAIDNLLNDWRARLAAVEQEEERIVIVDVDERSLAKEGAWPWARPKIAALLDNLLTHYQVTGIAVDMVFPESRPEEDQLATLFRRPEVTGAVVYDLIQRNLPTLRTRLPAPPPLDAGSRAPLVAGVPVVANHTGLPYQRAGHITPIFDDDGVLRRVPPVICVQRKACRPILGLAAYAGLLEQPRLQVREGKGWLAPDWSLALQSGDGATVASLPLNADGLLTVPYRHRGNKWMTTVSAADILERRVQPEFLKGVIVLLGGTALGLSDLISTPMSPLAAGIEPHTEVLSALLDNDFPVEPAAGLWLDAILLLPFALVLAWALGRFNRPIQRAALFPIWLLLTFAGSAAIAMAALTYFRLLLPLLPFLLFPPLALLLTVLADVYRSRSAHDGVLSLLATYLPRSVANRLAGGAEARRPRADGVMDASRRNITVMFADIHGFAGITEDRPPEVVARLMQKVFHEMADSVVLHGGTIDKFIGDAIMAFWNAPEDDPAHAEHALACAFDIVQRMQKLTTFCAELGLPPIHVGIGIETGVALVGNFGSALRRTFTALGEPVVLASRLEGLTKFHNEAILVGPGCAATIGDSRVRQLITVQIRGRIHPLTLYVPK